MTRIHKSEAPLRNWNNNWHNSVTSQQLPPLSARVPSRTAKSNASELVRGTWVPHSLVLHDRAPVSDLCVLTGGTSTPTIVAGRHDNTIALHSDATQILTDDFSGVDLPRLPLRLEKACTYVLAAPDGFWSVCWHGSIKKWAAEPTASCSLTAAASRGNFCTATGTNDETFYTGTWGGFEQRCMESGAVLCHYEHGHQSAYVSAVAVSGDSILSCGSEGSWLQWNSAQSCAPVRTIVEGLQPLWCCAISGQSAFAGCRDSYIYSTGLSGDSQLQTLEGHSGGVEALQAVGGLLASGSTDTSIRVWDIEAMSCLYVMSVHTNDVVALSVQLGTSNLISGSHDGQVLCWDLSHQCELGCGEKWPSTRAGLLLRQEHQENCCPQRIVPCANGCSKHDLKAIEVDQHLTDYCELRMVECGHCGASPLVAKDLEVHCAAVCPCRVVECPLGCDIEGLMHKDLEQHVSELCPRRVIQCPLGCAIDSLLAMDCEVHSLMHCPNRTVDCPNGCPIRDLTEANAEEHAATVCPYRKVLCSLGCGALMRPSEMDQHEVSECPNRPVKCPLGCGSKGLYCADVDKHVTDECPFRIVGCPLGCGSSFAEFRSGEHRAVCGMRPVLCPLGCGLEAALSVLEPHMEHECPKREVNCSLCLKPMFAEDLHKHETTECPLAPCECPNGCDVEGLTIGSLRMHLNHRCPYRIVDCSLGCGKQTVSDCLKDHMATECPRRVVKCKHGCGIRNLTAAEAPAHEESCLVTCPLGCGCRWLKHGQLAAHCDGSLEEHPGPCPLAAWECPSGCNNPNLKLCDSAQHLAESCPHRIVQCRWDRTHQIKAMDLEEHEAICPAAVVVCQWNPTHSCTRADLAAHESLCPDRSVVCPLGCCLGGISARLLDRHMQVDCPARPAECPYQCGQPLQAEQLTVHCASECPNRVVACKYLCQSVVKLRLQAKDQQQHEQHECPMRIVVCSVCQLEVQACELDTHKKEVCQMAELDDPSAVVQSTQELLGHWTSSPSKQEPPAAEEEPAAEEPAAEEPAAEEAVVVEEEPSAEEAAAAEEVAELMQKLKALQEGAPAAEDPNKWSQRVMHLIQKDFEKKQLSGWSKPEPTKPKFSVDLDFK